MQVTINVPDNIPRHELKYRIKEFEESLVDGLTVDQGKKGVLRDVLLRLRSKGTFSAIKDPVAWQREVRGDRDLPCRQ